VLKNGGKVVVLMEIIEESLKQGEKILIFRWDYQNKNTLFKSTPYHMLAPQRDA